MDGLTGSEIAGFVVGALLLGATIAAPKVDGFIASSQRRSLGMCKRCDDLQIVACSQCKGMGSVRKGGVLSLGMLDDLYESLGAEFGSMHKVQIQRPSLVSGVLEDCMTLNNNGTRKYKVLSYAHKSAALIN